MKNLQLLICILIFIMPDVLQAQRPSILNEQTYDSEHFKFHYTTDSASADVVNSQDKLQ